MGAWPQMSWREPTTAHQRFFDELSGGDRRQLWARDTRLPPDADLVYLDVGEAPRYRREGLVPNHMLCPMPGCPCPRFKTARGGSKRDGFVHEFDPELDHHGPVAACIHAASLILQWARQAGRLATREEAPAAHAVGVTASSEGGDAVHLVFVAEQLAAPEIDGVVARARNAGAIICWLLWNRRPLLDAAAATERRPLAVWTGHAQKLARYGRVVWLSPDRRLVAIPAGPSRGQRSTEVFVTPLLDCRMGSAGPLAPGVDSVPDPQREHPSPARRMASPRRTSSQKVRTLCRQARVRDIAIMTLHGWLVAEVREALGGDVNVRHVGVPSNAGLDQRPEGLAASLRGVDLLVAVELPERAEGVHRLTLPCARCRVDIGRLDAVLLEVEKFAAARAEKRRWDW